MTSMHSPQESDEFQTVSYEASPPRRRDFWKVLRGSWTPDVRRVVRPTLKGADRTIRELYQDPIKDSLNDQKLLFGGLE